MGARLAIADSQLVSESMHLDLAPKIIVDLFAGGGGTSTGIEMGLGISPHVAINHNDDALSMHRMNHPTTRHYIADVFEVCPKGVVKFFGNRPIAALHASPDCTHHSQAANGQPRDEKIRALSWVVVRWAGQVRPDFISVENVKQLTLWGPLVAKRDPMTGRVLKTDGTVAAPGEVVPRNQQYLVPDKKKAGRTWRRFVSSLEGMGYKVEWRRLVAADYDTGTTRERLFLIARCDGKPIVWPEATNAKEAVDGKKTWVGAAESIDWSIECPSIFTRKRPLAGPTLKRIARGMDRFVLSSDDPYIVPTAPNDGSDLVAGHISTFRSNTDGQDLKAPLKTITAGGKPKRDSTGNPFSLCTASLIQAAHGDGQPGRAQRWGKGCRDVRDPIGAVTGSGGHALAVATMVQTGYGEREGQASRCLDIRKPLGTAVAGGVKHALAIAYLMQANGGFCTTSGHDLREPMSTITNTGSQQQLICTSLVDYQLTQRHLHQALQVAMFLVDYSPDEGRWLSIKQRRNALTVHECLELVTVVIKGTAYVMVDIGLRMLVPQELYRAQGFPANYIIDHGHDGRVFTRSKQVRMVGNSVPPKLAAAIYRANLSELAVRRTA